MTRTTAPALRARNRKPAKPREGTRAANSATVDMALKHLPPCLAIRQSTDRIPHLLLVAPKVAGINPCCLAVSTKTLS